MRLDLTQAKLRKFKKWLQDNGAEILPTPENPYEVLRAKGGRGTVIIYRNEADQLSTGNKFTDTAISEWRKGGVPWSGRKKRVKRKTGRDYKIKLLDRDGNECFYCFEELGDDMTEEHLVPLTQGGANCIGNKVLSCPSCNNAMDNKSLVDKIKYRDKNLLRKKGIAEK